MTTPAQVRDNFLAAALSAVPHGDRYTAAFKRLGMTGCTSIKTKHSSFATATPDPGAITSLAAAITAAKTPADKHGWPTGATGTNMLTLVVTQACLLTDKETEAIAATLTPAPAAPRAAAAAAPAAPTKEDNERTATLLFERAELAHRDHIAAHQRVAYSTIGKLHHAATNNSPMAIGLHEYGRQLRVGVSTQETYEHMGKTFVLQGEATKAADIKTVADFFEQCKLREQAEVVSGCFDVDSNARSKGTTPPGGDRVLGESRISYATRPATGPPAVQTANLFATPQVQKEKIEAMQLFVKRHPHVSVQALVHIYDKGVEQRIADLKLAGYTADAAVRYACNKCPELYAPSLATSAAAGGGGDEHDPSTEKGGKRAKKSPAVERTAEDRTEALQRALDNKEKQIANLKKGKGNGGPKGKSNWGNWNGPPAFNQGGWAQPPPGKGNGPPGGGDTCRDFNHKVSGCTRPQCRFRHACSVCGSNHPAQGNH